MKLYIDRNFYDFSLDELDSMYLGEGLEGVVYQFQGKALKVYNPHSQKTRLQEDDARRLSEIETKRFHLPKGLLYDSSHRFIGYYTDYITNYSLDHIPRMKKKDIVDELMVLESDCDTLSDHCVSIEDLHRNNIIYDGKIHIIDPGSYQFEDGEFVRYLKSNNQRILREFVIDYILAMNLSFKKRATVQKHFEDVEVCSDCLLDEMKPQETVKSYVKRILDK